MSKPARSAISAAATNSAVTRSMSARVIARGTWLAGDHGTADADMTSQLPSGRGRSASSHPTWVLPLRPLWPIWQHTLAAVSPCTKRTRRAHSASCSGA